MPRTKLREIGALMALGISYATTYVTAYIWDWPSPDSELLIYIFVIFLISFLFGAEIVDMKKTLFYMLAAIAVGFSIACLVIIAPALTLTTELGLLEFDLTVALTAVSRLFIIGITFKIIGAITGCFAGDAISELNTI